jgi:hypothetical protein
MTLDVKNDGNVPIVLVGMDVSYGASANHFSVTPANMTLISGTAAMQPGDSLTAKVKTSFPVPGFATFTVTVIGDQVAKAFNIQA